MAAKGLKLAEYSASCGETARVTGKGARENMLEIEGLRLKVKTATRIDAQRSDKRCVNAAESDENTGNGSIVLAKE